MAISADTSAAARTSTASDADAAPAPVNAAKQLPAAYRALVALDRSLGDGPIPPATRELVRIRASQINRCAYCLDMHTLDALDAGETPLRLGVIAAWEEAVVFTPAERSALAVTEAITRISDSHVPAAVEAEARRHYDDEAYAALVYEVILINAWNRLAIASHTAPGNYRPGDHAS